MRRKEIPGLSFEVYKHFENDRAFFYSLGIVILRWIKFKNLTNRRVDNSLVIRC